MNSWILFLVKYRTARSDVKSLNRSSADIQRHTAIVELCVVSIFASRSVCVCAFFRPDSDMKTNCSSFFPMDNLTHL